MALGAFVTAQEIEPWWHIKMQAAFQKCVDSAISKTINMPNHATTADIADAYQLAWESGCLGITVFRDGCKSEQVLNVGVKADTQQPEEPTGLKGTALEEAQAEVLHLQARLDEMSATNQRLYDDLEGMRAYATELEGKAGHPIDALLGPFVGGIKARPAVVRGYTRQVQAPEGKLNITINSDDDGPFEVFLNVGRAGSDIAAMAEGIGRLISFTLRLDSALSQEERLHEIARQLQGIGGSGSIGFGPHRVASLSDAIARALAQHLSEMEQSPAASEVVVPLELQLPVYQVAPVATNGNGHKVKIGNLCNACGNTTMVREEGCMKCLSCGASKC
jgi:ribonucleoside-diphosphate reductase alpha chain